MFKGALFEKVDWVQKMEELPCWTIYSIPRAHPSDGFQIREYTRKINLFVVLERVGGCRREEVAEDSWKTLETEKIMKFGSRIMVS